MGLTDGVPRLLSCLLLISVLVDGNPLLPGKPHKGPTVGAPRVSEPTTVVVRCHESGSMEILVLADLFRTGVLIDGADLRLGRYPLVKGPQLPVKCGAAVSGEGQYVIFADLTDCGTERAVTEYWLVYRNSLFYSPAPLPNGIIRMEEIEMPFECLYQRKYSVDSNGLVPTWVPFITTQSAVDVFHFSLRLLTEDWQSERPSNVYFLGEDIHLEAYVVQGNHVPLRVFVNTCMATLVPDVDSDPRYAFIENGCLTDSKATGSRSSFLPRSYDNYLHFQLEAFRFYQHSTDSIYITCLLEAEAVALVGQSTKEACSYADGSWTAADGNDQACDRCDGPPGFSTGKKTPKRGAKAEVRAAGRAAFTTPAGASVPEKSVTIGPLRFPKLEQVRTAEVLATERSGTSVDTPAVMATTGSAEDPSAVTTDSGTVVDTTMVLPVKQGNASVEDPAVLVAGQVEALNNSTVPSTGWSASTEHTTPGLSFEAGTDVDTLAASEEMYNSSTSILVTEPAEIWVDLKTEKTDSPVGPFGLDTLGGEGELEGSAELWR